MSSGGGGGKEAKEPDELWDDAPPAEGSATEEMIARRTLEIERERELRRHRSSESLQTPQKPRGGGTVAAQEDSVVTRTPSQQSLLAAIRQQLVSPQLPPAPPPTPILTEANDYAEMEPFRVSLLGNRTPPQQQDAATEAEEDSAIVGISRKRPISPSRLPPIRVGATQAIVVSPPIGTTPPPHLPPPLLGSQEHFDVDSMFAGEQQQIPPPVSAPPASISPPPTKHPAPSISVETPGRSERSLPVWLSAM
jgi:hypothetical protein